VLLRQVTV